MKSHDDRAYLSARCNRLECRLMGLEDELAFLQASYRAIIEDREDYVRKAEATITELQAHLKESRDLIATLKRRVVMPRACGPRRDRRRRSQ